MMYRCNSCSTELDLAPGNITFKCPNCYNIGGKALRYNEGKPQWHLVNFASLEPLVRVLEFGAQKYGEGNWEKPQDRNALIDSLLRHVTSLADGEENDRESGLPHTGHIIANAMFYSYHFGNKHK